MRGRRQFRMTALMSVAVGLAATVASTPPVSAAASLPGFLQVGSRLTWSAGDASLEGTKLVADPNGWLLRDGQWYRVESTGGSGGVGYEQLDVLSATDDAVVADVRFFLTTDLERNINVSNTSGLAVGTAEALGEYWIAPARLAALPEGFDGVTRIFRGQCEFNGRNLEVVASATFGSGNYAGYTYDLATGLLLVGGTMTAGPGVLVTDDSGNLLDQAAGAVHYTHRQLVGVRQLSVPWAGGAAPAWATSGLVRSYQGETRVEFDPSAGVPNVAGQPLTVTQTFDRVVGTAIIGRQSTRSATAAGLPPTETILDRAYGSAQLDGLWIGPESIAQLQPQQVLDQDPITGQTVTFAGIQGAAAVVVATGPGDQLEQFYDTRSGLLTFSRYRRQIPGVGTSITELALVQQP